METKNREYDLISHTPGFFFYHLEKRITELLSMALKGPKAERHTLRHSAKMFLAIFSASSKLQPFLNLYLRPTNTVEETVEEKSDEPAKEPEKKSDAPAQYRLKALMNVRVSPHGRILKTLAAGTVVEVVSVDNDWLHLTDGSYILFHRGEFAEKT